LTPDGARFTQRKAGELTKYSQLVLLCGHYEGIDQRVRDRLIDEELSIGDYVLSGGEIPAMAVVDSVVRLIPGVLGRAESLEDESFNKGTLDYPHYTRPAVFKGWKVPSVLLSGDHPKIKDWRKKQALQKTKKRRPDILGEHTDDH